MNRQLEKIIKENRPSFDNQLPPDGHLLRFEQRLILQRRRRNTKYRIRFVAAVAASILLLFWILPRDQVVIKPRRAIFLALQPIISLKYPSKLTV